MIPAFSLAQSNYKPGYIVTLNNDTIKGFVDYRVWDKNPKTISFKKAIAGNQKETYNPATILAFGIYGFEKYVSFTGMISNDHFDMRSAATGIDTSKVQDTVFLRIVYSGAPLALYTYNNDKKERFFISDEKSKPEELTYYIFMSNDNDQIGNIAEQKGYQAQLNYYAVKYQPGNYKLSTCIQHTDYSERGLAQALNKINGKTGTGRLSTMPGNSRFFMGIAVNESKINFIDFNYKVKDASNSYIFPKINVGADLFANENAGAIILKAELGVTGNHINIIQMAPGGDDYTDEITLKFNQYIVSFNPQLLYNFYNAVKIKFYISGGVAVNYNIYSNKKYIIQFNYSTGLNYVNIPTYPDLQSTSYNFTIKAGCELNNRFDIYAGYDPGSSINNDQNYRVKFTSYYAGINYLFGK